MADGLYYSDLRQPFTIADLASVTLATTQKCMWAPGAASPTVLPANYWTVGKAVRMHAFLKLVIASAGSRAKSKYVWSWHDTNTSMTSGVTSQILSDPPRWLMVRRSLMSLAINTL